MILTSTAATAASPQQQQEEEEEEEPKTSSSLGCASPGCTNDLSSSSSSSSSRRLACPKCLELGLPPAYFCSQECFKQNYAQHKQVHVLAKQQKQKQKRQPQPPQPQFLLDDNTCDPSAPQHVRWSLPAWARHCPTPNFAFTGPLRPALQSPKRSVPAHIRRPDYADHVAGVSLSEQRVYNRSNGRSNRSSRSNMIPVYASAQLDGEVGLRHACHMGREVLDIAGKALRVGVTTDEIDRIVHEATVERDCYPSPLNYYEFPKSVCTSVNEVICHGIPDYREIQDGDLVNIDISVYNRGGYHGDLNETFHVGNSTSEHNKDSNLRLIRTAFECLRESMAIVKPGTLYRDLGNVIDRVATQNQCSVVRTYCGHGIGTLFHTLPNIPHYAHNKAVGTMRTGHVFTIEPMINDCASKKTGHLDVTWLDHWTAVTRNGCRSAQFEHTILVTDTGFDILTARDHEPVMVWNPDLIIRAA